MLLHHCGRLTLVSFVIVTSLIVEASALLPSPSICALGKQHCTALIAKYVPILLVIGVILLSIQTQDLHQ